MPPPQNPTELALVKAAIGDYSCRGSFEWDDRCAAKVRDLLQEFTPEEVRRLTYEAVVYDNLPIKQVRETRGFPYDYYYKVIVPVPEFRHGLFVEMVLEDSDPNDPVVAIKNAHEQLP